VRFADDRVGQLSVTFGVKVPSDSHLRNACLNAFSRTKSNWEGRRKVPFERAIFYKSAPSSITEI
jgi:hypothetical protein